MFRRSWLLVPILLTAAATPLVDVSPDAAIAATTSTFAASADTYVQDSTVATNYGNATQVVTDASPARRAFLKFSVADLTGVVSAKLRLHVSDVVDAGSPDGGTVRGVADTTWAESAVTWNQQPGYGTTLGSLGAVTRNTWYEIDVTAAVAGAGSYSFALTSTNSDGAYYDSRESGATAPQLVVTGTPTVRSFTASADAYVEDTAPTSNFGSGTRLVADASPVRRTFLTFTVSGLTAPVTTASLRLRAVDATVNDGSVSGGSVRGVADTSWSETGITWDTRPALGATYGTLGGVAPGTWYEVDVTAAISGDGTYSFAVTSASTDGAYYSSREAGTAVAPQLVVRTGSAVLVGAGDISRCTNANDETTAKLLDGVRGRVYTTGDNVYDDGTATEFTTCYGPTWGRHKARTWPVPGNHDYHTDGAAGYYGYFGANAGDPAKGYYSYDLGAWHVVVINSECSAIGGCHAGSTQETWLRSDLAANSSACTVAMWHHPLFTSSSSHSPSTAMRPIFQALYDHDADVVLTGHAHDYERFAPQTPSGGIDAADGIRAFVVGTGGADFHPFNDEPQDNSEVRNSNTFGVLKLTLHANSYDWQFLPQPGRTFTDSGSSTCH